MRLLGILVALTVQNLAVAFQPSSGLSFSKVSRNWQLSCRVPPVFRREIKARGTALHMLEGSDPLSSLEELEQRLESAVGAEDYERAAEIRDKINSFRQDNYIAVLQANSEFYRAFRERSTSAMKAVWHDPGDDNDQKMVVCAHPGMPPIVGRDDVLESWSNILGDGAPRIHPENVKISIVGDVAWVTCEEKFAAEPGMGTPPFGCLATNIFVRSKAGWRMTHHHAGPVQGRIGLVGD